MHEVMQVAVSKISVGLMSGSRNSETGSFLILLGSAAVCI